MDSKLVVLGIPWDIDTEGLREYMSKFGDWGIGGLYCNEEYSQSIWPSEVCVGFVIGLLIKTSSNVFATSKDFVDTGYVEFSGSNVKIASFVLEMWFRWHRSLWIYCPLSVKDYHVYWLISCINICIG